MIKNIIDSIAQKSGRLDKESILMENKDNDLLKKVVKYALSPRILFYIEKIPKYEPKLVNPKPLEWGITMLDSLVTREVTGNDAINHLKSILESLRWDDAKVIELIIAKDLRCGVAEKTINKIWEDLTPISPYCRCSLAKDMPKINWEEGIYTQTKFDGMFVNLTKENYQIELTTRNGNILPLDKFIGFNVDGLLLPEGQYHGELLVKQDGEILPREIGNGIVSSVLKGGNFEENQHPVFMAWDYITLEDLYTGKSSNSYVTRLFNLKQAIDSAKHISLVDTKLVHSYQEMIAEYHKNLQNGEEGIIVKLPTFKWKDGTSREQFKFKQEVPVELEIVGYNKGQGKHTNTFGSLVCKSSDGKIVVNVSGFKDKERLDIWNNMDYYIGKIVTVKSNGIQYSNTPHSLFLPQFVEIRLDKTVADSLTQIEQQFENSRIGL